MENGGVTAQAPLMPPAIPLLSQLFWTLHRLSDHPGVQAPQGT